MQAASSDSSVVRSVLRSSVIALLEPLTNSGSRTLPRWECTTPADPSAWRPSCEVKSAPVRSEIGGLGTELVGNQRNGVRGEATSTCVLEDDLGVVGFVHAVDLVPSDVAVDPVVWHSE